MAPERSTDLGSGGRTTAWRRRLAFASLVVATSTLFVDAPARAQEPADTAEEMLAERFAPVVVVKQQEGPCDTNGEPFEPAPVEIVLDNPEVFLRAVGNDDPVAMRGPTSADLFDLREGWYLDFPGDALEPGCVFEQDFERFWDGTSVVYAHITSQDDRPGLLALQYWMFWYHNPAKNNHEGDWEFVQLLFEADSAADALNGEPVAVGYAQHTGGERSSWDDSKLERDGDRPVVYAARGSHASYFGSALYLGRSSREGFGCDDTSGPSRQVDPQVVLLPDAVTDPADPLAWLSFQGRWGQREAGFFNGPTGPLAKGRWTDPVTWHDDLRSSSVVIPGGDRFGDGAVSVFCESVEVGSRILRSTMRSPAVALVVAVTIALLAFAAVRATTWTPVTTRPLRHRRAVGQILRASWRVWIEHPRAMLTIGLIFLPVAILTGAVQELIFSVPLVDDLVELAGGRSEVAFLLSVMVGGAADLLTFVYVAAAVSRVVDVEGRRATRVLPTAHEVRALLRGLVRATLVVGALLLSVVGIPFAIRQLVRYQFMPQAVVLEGRSGRAGLDRSTEIVRGRWWWTAGVVIGVEVAVALAGFGASIAFLLVVRSVPLWAFNLVSGLIYIVLVPIGAAAVTFAYGTLVASRTADDQETDAPSDPADRPHPEPVG